jgi:hypothetical protein
LVATIRHGAWIPGLFEPFAPMMRLIRKLFEMLAIAVNLGLGLFSFALGILGWIAHGELHVPLVPVDPEHVATSLVVAGAFGILAACLAIRGGRWNSFLMLLWSCGVVLVLGSTVFRSDFRFNGMTGFAEHGWMFLGSLVLLYGTWLRFRTPRRRKFGSRMHMR